MGARPDANRPVVYHLHGSTRVPSSIEWTFHGLIRRYPAIRRRRHVSVQLAPSHEDVKPGAEARAREYLDRYFDGWEVSVYWGTPRQFCAELARRMGTTT